MLLLDALLLVVFSRYTLSGPVPAYVYPEHVRLSYGVGEELDAMSAPSFIVFECYSRQDPLQSGLQSAGLVRNYQTMNFIECFVAFKIEPQMVVTWTTFNLTGSIVEYGTNKLSSVEKGNVTVFYDKEDTKRTWFIHRVVLKDLKPGVKYYYHCGSDLGWSDLFYFTNRRIDSNWAPWLAVYGDMGSENGQSIPRLQQEVAKKTIDAVLHVGDFAYNLDDDFGRVGDAFMQQIEPIAAYVPYMTVVGNHEFAYNFTHYKQRFSMPGKNNGIFYSFNLGQAHYVAISTEVYYYTQFGTKQIQTQWNWLLEDLKEANKPENRARYPWVIVLGHRPMYCAIMDFDDCDYVRDKVRVHLEKLLYDQGVDIEIWAHEHEYQRMYPMYNYTMCKSSEEAPYKNPRAPVHIVTGSAGCRERHDTFPPKPFWIAKNSLDYGYTRLNVINATHLYMEQISDDQHGAVVDKVMIETNRHGAGVFDCHKDRNY